jgi:hypothetical protein
MDIVERLRLVVGDLPPKGHVPLAQEAAAEIERLRELLKRVRKHGGIEPQLDAEIDAALSEQ